MLKQATAGIFRFAAARIKPAAPRLLDGSALHRRSLYILPTREGIYYGAMLVVMLLAAINYSNGLAYALTFLLAAVGVVGILHTHRNLSGLRISAGPAPPVFAGEPARFTALARNDMGIARCALDITVEGQTRRIDVPAQGTTAVELTVATVRRGYLPAPALRLSTRFPLGLWRAWSRPLALPARCLVYPRPAPERALHATPDLLAGLESARNTEGEDFAGLREFRHGDPVQRVAWKKVAAGQGWHTKQFATPASRVVWFEWNALAGFDEEERLSVLCRCVLMAELHGVAYGLRLPGITLGPANGVSHRSSCLERLALFNLPP
jgi:uncharacterized protein (DUF58 family)